MQKTNIAKLGLVKRAKNSLSYMESKRSLSFAQNLKLGITLSQVTPIHDLVAHFLRSLCCYLPIYAKVQQVVSSVRFSGLFNFHSYIAVIRATCHGHFNFLDIIMLIYLANS